jgi:hypothetical protein
MNIFSFKKRKLKLELIQHKLLLIWVLQKKKILYSLDFRVLFYFMNRLHFFYYNQKKISLKKQKTQTIIYISLRSVSFRKVSHAINSLGF